MDAVSTFQSMPREQYRVGTALDRAGTIRVASIEPFGVNYRVSLSTGFGIVVPPRYIHPDARSAS